MPTVTEVFGTVTVELVKGDITQETVEGIVNAANAGLQGGGGVDGAIHAAGGPAIMKACRVIGGCPTGTAVVTTAGKLKAKKVIHTAGPIWRGGGSDEAKLLRACYHACLEQAEAEGLRSLAFPSISTGVYGYPAERAARVALTTVREHVAEGEAFDLIRFVLFDDATFKAYRKALKELLAGAEE